MFLLLITRIVDMQICIYAYNMLIYKYAFMHTIYTRVCIQIILSISMPYHERVLKGKFPGQFYCDLNKANANPYNIFM